MSAPADYLKLHPDDNVVVLIRSLDAGASIELAGTAYSVSEALALGHKIAASDISAGEKILKYGMPIGSASEDISQGEHVHLHNMQSDYLSTYTLEEVHTYGN